MCVCMYVCVSVWVYMIILIVGLAKVLNNWMTAASTHQKDRYACVCACMYTYICKYIYVYIYVPFSLSLHSYTPVPIPSHTDIRACTHSLTYLVMRY